MKANAPLTIRTVTTLDEFKGLAGDWEQLLRTVPGHSLFLTWEWLYYWSTHYLKDHRLRVLLAFDEHERLVGIAPFYLRIGRDLGPIPMRELRFLGSEAVCSAYLDIITGERDKRAVCRSLYRYLFNDARNDWDILTLSAMPAESSTIDEWNELYDEAGKVGAVVGTSCCPVIRLPGDVDTYRTGLGRNKRYTVQRKTTCLQRAGRMEYARATSPAEVDAAFGSLVALHQKRWSLHANGGVFADDRARQFHREVVQVLSERGRVSLDLLKLDGRPIAAIYGFVYEGCYSFYLPGFDPLAMPKASPGLLLLHHRIEAAIREGMTTVDLLQGAQPYKLEWSTDRRRLVTVRYYNRHVRAAALKLCEGAKQAIKVLVR
ncbi:MAG: GNAT family N-acetyltransferase [Nitrospira sp.]|nr:GNAT family N-acetyltransferase [Rhodocyclaceae bacterium]MCW5787693.1 GNAT family N-acetyltransferase [Nitrospira sp.]